MHLLTYQRCNFTRVIKKIVLRKDVEGLGFAGEVCFVKPGRALNDLIPSNKAYFWTDPSAQKLLKNLNMTRLRKMQAERKMEVFLNKLKDIKLIFDREVSEINKNVATEPVEASEILEALNKRYALGISKDDFRMESGLDTMGEHLVTVIYKSEMFKKDFTFYAKVQLKPK